MQKFIVSACAARAAFESKEHAVEIVAHTWMQEAVNEKFPFIEGTAAHTYGAFTSAIKSSIGRKISEKLLSSGMMIIVLTAIFVRQRQQST